MKIHSYLGVVVLKTFIFLFISLVMVLSGCSNETVKSNGDNWEESSKFIREIVVTADGQTENLVLRIGNNGRLGVQAPQNPFIAGQSSKYFWLFWGDNETLTKPVKIVGEKRDSGETLTVFEIPQKQQLAPLYGADHTMPSTMKLPSAGYWMLNVYFGDELFGNVVVDVEEK